MQFFEFSRMLLSRSLIPYISLIAITFVIFFGYNKNTPTSANYDANQVEVIGEEYCSATVQKYSHQAVQIAPDPSFHPSVPSCLEIDQVQVEIYMYHYVRPTRWDQYWSVVWNNSITPEQAREHYEYIADLVQQDEIHVAWMSDIQKYQATNCFPHERMVVLTFDDGRWDNYEFLLPLAKEFDIKANLGIVANRISRDAEDRIDSFMTYDEIRQMIDSGYFEISGHSLTHTNLQQKWSTSQREEICTSTKSLENIFDVTIDTFIYPMGLYNQTSMDTVFNCGLSYWLTTRDGVNDSYDLTYDRAQLYRKRVSRFIPVDLLFGG